MLTPLAAVEELTVRFPTRDGTVHALEGVSLSLGHGETVALVGESGCGKSTFARALALLRPPTSGSIFFGGQPVLGLSRRHLRPVRRRIQMVFQDPYHSLNPRLPVGRSIEEPLVIHGLGTREERSARAEEVAAAVGIDPCELRRYPHEFSGGQQQRIAIARALAPRPDLVIADEPLSSLDLPVQGQILRLFAELRQTTGASYLFISHSLPTVRFLAQRIAVLYLGRIVELAANADLFGNAQHPYTHALFAAMPSLERGKRVPGETLAGEPPSALHPPAGCPFHPRCPRAREVCRRVRPLLEEKGGACPGHLAACHFAGACRPEVGA